MLEILALAIRIGLELVGFGDPRESGAKAGGLDVVRRPFKLATDIGPVDSIDQRLDGRPVRVRFVWSPNLHTGAPRWQQSFSGDGGRTWEMNWVMEFSRAAD